MFWGLTPSLDLNQVYKNSHKTTPDELNILLIGGADARHVLKTLSRRYRHGKINLNFYILEACQETVAKQLLLLYVALQPDEELALVQKTRIFMELYGNSLLRPGVAKYLHSTAVDFVNMITDYDHLHEIMPYVSFELKYKDRDYLENLFKFWCSQDEFNICESWDKRLRKTLGFRYDNKLGAFDWDLHMRLHPQGAKQICNQEYRNWRLHGIAFTWLESDVSKTNRSLVCGVIPNGNKFAHYGYLGDMETGPFITYGLECEDETFLKKMHNQNAHRATDVIERNLMQMFHEIQTDSVYDHQATNEHQLGSVVTQLSNVRVVDVQASGEKSKGRCKTCIPLEDFAIKFVSISNLKSMQYNEMLREFFDVIYFGCAYVKHLEKEFVESVARKKAVMLVENRKFVVGHRKEQLVEFGESIKTKTDVIDCEALPFDCQRDDFAEFIIKT